MTSVGRLLAEYMQEHRRGGDADPIAFLDRAAPGQRNELAALIAELDSAESALTLAEWAAATRQALVASGEPTRGSAADLVLADRRRRSEETSRL